MWHRLRNSLCGLLSAILGLCPVLLDRHRPESTGGLDVCLVKVPSRLLVRTGGREPQQVLMGKAHPSGVTRTDERSFTVHELFLKLPRCRAGLLFQHLNLGESDLSVAKACATLLRWDSPAWVLAKIDTSHQTGHRPSEFLVHDGFVRLEEAPCVLYDLVDV